MERDVFTVMNVSENHRCTVIEVSISDVLLEKSANPIADKIGFTEKLPDEGVFTSSIEFKLGCL
jgi:hypothetical protein